MGKEEVFDFESIQDNTSIADHLKSLIDGFEKGQIRLNTNSREMVLKPNNLLQFTLKARRKGEKNKLSLKISWKDKDALPTLNENINIGS